MIHTGLYIDNTKEMGRGIFTSQDLAADTVIEESPVIVMSKEERAHLDKTLLHDYIFEWGKDEDQCCMALGLVPIYNHSYKANCEYFMQYDDETILVKTVRVVAKDEELLINYNGDWNDSKPLWFETK